VVFAFCPQCLFCILFSFVLCLLISTKGIYSFWTAEKKIIFRYFPLHGRDSSATYALCIHVLNIFIVYALYSFFSFDSSKHYGFIYTHSVQMQFSCYTCLTLLQYISN
jgi:hypothetical protein